VILIKAASGHNNAAGYVELQCYQPADIEYAEFLDALDLSVIPQGGRFSVLRFNTATYAEMTAILTAFGLSHTVFSANCTVSLQDNGGTFDDYNGNATHRTGKQRSDSGGAWWYTEITVRDLDEV
jgi:hypothetical protein